MILLVNGEPLGSERVKQNKKTIREGIIYWFKRIVRTMLFLGYRLICLLTSRHSQPKTTRGKPFDFLGGEEWKISEWQELFFPTDQQARYSFFSVEKQSNIFFQEIILCRIFFTPFENCWFSHDVTKLQTSELLILLKCYFHDE